MGGIRIKQEIFLPSPEATLLFGRHCGAVLPSHSLLALNGDLGAGKTTFVQGLADALGVEEIIQSPTFSYLNIYPGGKLPLYHFDLYRLHSNTDFFALGFDEYCNEPGIAVIEWAEKIASLLPKETIHIQLQHEEGARIARVSSIGNQKLVESILSWDC